MSIRQFLFPFLSTLITVFVLATAPVSAQQKDKQEQPTKTTNINKTEAADRARQQVKGRVLKVEKKKNQYRVKVLQKSGRVVSVDVDKNSGKVKDSSNKKKDQ